MRFNLKVVSAKLSSFETQKTILLIEDEHLIAEYEAGTLQKYGYSVIQAYSGEKAVEVITSGTKVDLILSDINLGKGIDGVEAAKQILAVRHTPIIFLTSHSEREIVESTTQVISYGYLVKDSNDFIMLQTIKKALQLFETENELKRSLEIVSAQASDLIKAQKVQQELNNARSYEQIGQLGRGIAHDFNNKLTGVLGRISLLKLSLKDLPPEKAEDMLEDLLAAERGARDAADYAKKLLAFTKGGAPVKSLIELAGLIRDTVDLHTSGSDVQCEFDLASDLWAVEADPTQFKQVIQNLVINAVQAFEPSASDKLIRIIAANVLLEEQASGGLGAGAYIRVRVVDNGLGIPEEIQDRIFEPLFTTKFKGNGIGLSASFEIIKAHGGKLDFRSSPKGTTMEFYVPATSRRPMEVITADTSIKQSYDRSARILFMDDEIPMQETAQRMLRKECGLDVTIVDNGESVLAAYRAAQEQNKPYALVILDLMIKGGLGGEETIKKLLEIDPQVNAVVSSGYSDKPIIAKHQEYGLKAVLPKPYSYEQMLAVLNKTIPLTPIQNETPGTGTILMIEDDRYVNDDTCEFLRDSGWQIIQAYSGAEGLEKFKTNLKDISLVICDLGEVQNGVLAEIQRISPTLQTVLMSGYGQNSPETTSFLKQLVHKDKVIFLGKPFSLFPTDVKTQEDPDLISIIEKTIPLKPSSEP